MKTENEVTSAQASWFLGIDLYCFLQRVKRGIYKHDHIKHGKKIYDLEELRSVKFIDGRKKKK